MSPEALDFYEDLDHSLSLAFDLLSDAVVNRHAPCHTPVISSIEQDENGNLTPSSRVVVLRAFDPLQRSFRFHTDFRSDKIAHFLKTPRTCGLFYDPAEKIQLRLTGSCRVDHDGALAEKAWDETRPFSRECYRIEPGPGAQIEPGSAYVQQPLLDGIDPGRDQFCAVEIQFDTIEWLFLASQGHRRARFSWDQNGSLTSCWLAP